MTKDFDIILFGATGFTGQIVARFLLQDAESAVDGPNALKWAIAGRNAKKLEDVKRTLKQKVPSVSASIIDSIPVVVADVKNEQQVVDMVKRTKVLMTLAGPYAFYGEPIVKACAENGVHYCDLTGELLWIDKMWGKYNDVAKKTGAVLIHSCGVTAVASDMAVALLADSVRKNKQSETSAVTLCYTQMKGGLSGGAMAGVFNMMETASMDDLNKMNDPFFLTDAKTIERKNKAGLTKLNTGSFGIKKEKDLKLWSSYFLYGGANSATVHRTNFLLNDAYSDKFVYRERSAIGGFFSQIGNTIGTSFGGMFLFFKWTRALIKLSTPKPGEGPPEEEMKKNEFSAKAAAYDANGKLAARLTMAGKGDPGYIVTSYIVMECAIALAKGEFAAPCAGFQTPASALGLNLAKRLNDKKIVAFDVKTSRDPPLE
ncbi:hypothetical protein Poli38472_009962 [Pythium oligandrum]|uniref:Saccharopine dehydrogenase NADP binding domain-containing protein n=1 Tax=Pythium oligandrum TaxID=41045 RepID=A0A8K1C907_PYTOL|nr:hypothetical protein Poli38472_009962 [Pythium oligandrum]|eukprot:TMW58403.1 hypothetical protein Poli38472_009962 [Pythium oligandrum]